MRCDVAAPSLTPHKPGQRVKTNRRDALNLARYFRAGELTLIAVPDEHRESLRDLIRARTAGQKDLLSVRHQISKLLLRYGQRYRDGRAWTKRFWSWLDKVQLEGEHSQFVLEEMIAAHAERIERVVRYTEAIEAAAQKPEYAPYVAALRVLRGIDTAPKKPLTHSSKQPSDENRTGSDSGVIPSDSARAKSTSTHSIATCGSNSSLRSRKDALALPHRSRSQT